MFDLLETLRFDPDDGLVDLPRHLDRLGRSAAALGFACDRHGIANELQAATFHLRAAARVRLRMAPSGTVALAVDPAPSPLADPRVAIVSLPVAEDDWRLRHKTSDRAFYDEARRASGCDEVLFVRADGLLTEGSFTNLFVAAPGGHLRTPPAARGLLPGILRARLLDEGRAVEADLTPDDLAGGFYLGNALRGLMPARLSR